MRILDLITNSHYFYLFITSNLEGKDVRNHLIQAGSLRMAIVTLEKEERMFSNRGAPLRVIQNVVVDRVPLVSFG